MNRERKLSKVNENIADLEMFIEAWSAKDKLGNTKRVLNSCYNDKARLMITPQQKDMSAISKQLYMAMRAHKECHDAFRAKYYGLDEYGFDRKTVYDYENRENRLRFLKEEAEYWQAIYYNVIKNYDQQKDNLEAKCQAIKKTIEIND